MIEDGQIVVPALALRTADGAAIDVEATACYAQRAARTWIDAFIVSGSTTHGDRLTLDERTQLLDLWLRFAGPARLVACCWCQDDLHEVTRRAITPMVVMRSRAVTSRRCRCLRACLAALSSIATRSTTRGSSTLD
ncbi:MAG: hypothetical protein ACRDLN_00715 [Solirubrobacteraceae bacterium]